MADQNISTKVYNDTFDIIFENRNKAYGAYQLRRAYPAMLTRAFLYALGLVLLVFGIPLLISAVRKAMPEKKTIDVIAELAPPPDIDPNQPPPPPPPPLETPPPPTRSTVKFVPPVVKKDEDVREEEPKKAIEELKQIDDDIGKETKEGNKDALPSLKDNPSLDDLPPEPAKTVPEKIFETFDIQKQPSFPGGEAELMKFLQENIQYPPLARDNNIQGRVVLTFVVGKDGRVSDVQVVKDIGGGCGKEAVRVVQSMPKWIPGEANGNPVKVRYTLPVMFRLAN